MMKRLTTHFWQRISVVKRRISVWRTLIVPFIWLAAVGMHSRLVTFLLDHVTLLVPEPACNPVIACVRVNDIWPKSDSVAFRSNIVNPDYPPLVLQIVSGCCLRRPQVFVQCSQFVLLFMARPVSEWFQTLTASNLISPSSRCCFFSFISPREYCHTCLPIRRRSLHGVYNDAFGGEN